MKMAPFASLYFIVVCLKPVLCGIYCNPMDIHAFQWLFRDKSLAIHMLNAFNVTESRVKDLTFPKTNGTDPIHADYPPEFYDISAVTEDNQQVKIEVQTRHEYFYMEKFKDLKMPRPGPYTLTRPVHVLAICRRLFVFPGLRLPVTHHKMVCGEKLWPGGRSYVFVELEKFKTATDDHTDAYKWMHFLKNAPDIEGPEEWRAAIGHDPVFERAFKIVEFKNWNVLQDSQYERSHMRETQFCDVINTAVRKGVEKFRVGVIRRSLEKKESIPYIARILSVSEENVRELIEKYKLHVK